VILFGIPVATFDRADRGSEVEVYAGAHVYLNGPKWFQSESNLAIWKAKSISISVTEKFGFKIHVLKFLKHLMRFFIC
jgi:hypothetical protein